jgi:hypothetical protein
MDGFYKVKPILPFGIFARGLCVCGFGGLGRKTGEDCADELVFLEGQQDGEFLAVTLDDVIFMAKDCAVDDEGKFFPGMRDVDEVGGFGHVKFLS